MIKRIVLTGGPCAGKTTALATIKKELCKMGYKVFIVNETATELINGGITPHEYDIGLLNFQKMVMLYQYQKEFVYNQAANNSDEDKIVIIYDRGILDNKAYISDLEFDNVLDYFFKRTGKKLNEFDIANRYDMVVHLVTTAGKGGYGFDSNQARYETEEEAFLLDDRTIDAWKLHDNLHIVNNTLNFSDKIDKLMDLIYSCLGAKDFITVKRKFLVELDCSISQFLDRFDAEELDVSEYFMDTAYDDEFSYRKLSWKGYNRCDMFCQDVLVNGNERILINKKISEMEFDSALNYNVISRLEKKCIIFIYKKHKMVLDIFQEGLMILEVMLNNYTDDFVIPECFDVLKDVTQDIDYRNINLGRIDRNSLVRRRKIVDNK